MKLIEIGFTMKMVIQIIQWVLDPEQIGAADSIGKRMSDGCLGGGPSQSF